MSNASSLLLHPRRGVDVGRSFGGMPRGNSLGFPTNDDDDRVLSANLGKWGKWMKVEDAAEL